MICCDHPCRPLMLYPFTVTRRQNRTYDILNPLLCPFLSFFPIPILHRSPRNLATPFYCLLSHFYSLIMSSCYSEETLPTIPPPTYSSVMTFGNGKKLILKDGTKCRVDVTGLTQVIYPDFERPEGPPSIASFFDTDAKVSYGGQASLVFQEGTTTFVAGPFVPDTTLNHGPLLPSLYHPGSTNTAVPDIEVAK
jgi:hypothetical protein